MLMSNNAAIDFLKEWYGKAKSFIVSKGFTALSSIVIGISLWVLGYKIAAGVAFGVFLTKNWEILKDSLKK